LAIEVTYFVQEQCKGTAEYSEVVEVAEALRHHLSTQTAQNLIAEANVPGASSALVQHTFLEFARRIGFVDESKGLFGGYQTSALRPDYFLRLGETGILLEVERGKTTINNMDLLDFWKCHLCTSAQYLFLLVPQQLVQNDRMAPRREYAAVVKRLGSFFVPRNYTNVRGLAVFGY
jgi:hypothetical protein